MTQKFTTVQTCQCKENEQEVRRTLEIQPGSLPTELIVVELKGSIRIGPEIVTSGQVTTQFGKSFDELHELGPGLHSVCSCRTIGAVGSVFKPMRNE